MFCFHLEIFSGIQSSEGLLEDFLDIHSVLKDPIIHQPEIAPACCLCPILMVGESWLTTFSVFKNGEAPVLKSCATAAATANARSGPKENNKSVAFVDLRSTDADAARCHIPSGYVKIAIENGHRNG